MNILMFLLLYAVPLPDLACSAGAPASSQALETGRSAPVVAVASLRPVAKRSSGNVPQAQQPVSDTASEQADLLFYVNSHAQAMSENAGASMNPWLELQPVGDFDVAPKSNQPTSSSGEHPAGRTGAGPDSGFRRACS